MKKIILYALIFASVTVFFSYKLVQIPPGITIDEGAFGYNAVLLSKTQRDENRRLMPVFVLSIQGKDWRQPVTQYFMAGFFKVFGASVYNLRMTSVVVVAISAVLIFVTADKLLGLKGAFTALLFFLTIPIVMIHSHLGLDNIMPIPFILVWLLSLRLYDKTGSLKFLVMCAISLGIGFYSYKGMRSFVPVWSVLTGIYIAWPYIQKLSRKSLVSVAKPFLTFALSLLPFYLVIPFLEYKYAGAVIGQSNIEGFQSVYGFMQSYLASFDLSFLFITGDAMLQHSTGKHGMFLLASLPFFILGLAKALKKDKFWVFIVLSFFLGPLLFGFPGSIHRASRLLAFVPLFSLISSLGAVSLLENKKLKTVSLVLFALLFINYADFLNYYWNKYPAENKGLFYNTAIADAYKILYLESEKRQLTPLVSLDIYKNEVGPQGAPDQFFRSIYFVEPPGILKTGEQDLPDNAILLTNQGDIPQLEKVGEIQNFNIYVR